MAKQSYGICIIFGPKFWHLCRFLAKQSYGIRILFGQNLWCLYMLFLLKHVHGHTIHAHVNTIMPIHLSLQTCCVLVFMFCAYKLRNKEYICLYLFLGKM